MRKEHYEIYRQLSDLYYQKYRLNESTILETHSDSAIFIKKVISDVALELNIEECLRPDARHFLVINFHQMILLPLINSINNEHHKIDDIFYLIEEDIRLILSSAKILVGDEKEISGSSVLKSVSFCYDSLYLSGNGRKRWPVIRNNFILTPRNTLHTMSGYARIITSQRTHSQPSHWAIKRATRSGLSACRAP
jgi:hypothetical protein